MPDNQGRLSPFTSSSSQHDEVNDNHVEYYVKPSGGEEKMLDVNSSETVDRGYDHTSSTEPDPTGAIAMKKFDNEEWQQTKESIRSFAKSVGATYTKPAEQDGVGTYSTTANTTLEAPASGDTTEPESVHKAATCMCKCEKCMKCVGMTKGEDEPEIEKAVGCDCCDECGADCSGDCCDNCNMTAKADKPESEETDADEPDADADDKEMKKSLWGNAFLPID